MFSLSLLKLPPPPPKTMTNKNKNENIDKWTSQVAENLPSDSSLFLKVSTHPIRQKAEEGKHLSSYTGDSICYLRPLLPSDTEKILEGSLKDFYFIDSSSKDFQLGRRSSRKGEKPSMSDEDTFIYWHLTWREPSMVKLPFQLGSVRSASVINAVKGAVPSHCSQRSCFWTSPSQRPFLIMPSQQKKIIFCMAGVLSFACALGVVTALGTPLWIKATILCKTGALLVNASGQELDKFMGEMQYGLFHGEGVRQCGLGARPFRFSCK